MASPFTFLMVLSTPTTLFRHWTLVLYLATFLYSSFYGPLPVVAEPTLVLHSVSNQLATGLILNETAAITPLVDPVFEDNPLVTISLENVVITFAFLGVTLTNLCAVTGFICIPMQRSKYFDLLMTFMMALAVSALFSTAILVLIPEAMRMADMPLEFGGQGHSYLVKLSCVPAGLLVFFCVEYVLHISPRLLKLDKPSSSEPDALLASTIKPENLAVSGGSDSLASQPITYSTQPSLSCLNCSVKGLVEIAPMAWMVLLGDSIHNFMDGMAIAVGFTESPLAGIAICLCILFEELPHELGDFAVLIISGFSVKSAICANFASACVAYLGLIIGLIIGEVSSGALYVFMATSGVFLYISLSAMLPSIRETLKEAEKKSGSSLGLFAIQIFGMVTGYACVLGVIHASSCIAF
ncbi:unnamed protein product [Taenia asiatica]|uniref:Zinc transporter ZIP8 n=1 Tax=Taenia asiatica TaxID=60517 RepID=A0A0R3VVQ9_TAEAS|nr:unnamed protein product [Taenia asiatica]